MSKNCGNGVSQNQIPRTRESRYEQGVSYRNDSD
jgi:hypothetical protein